MTVKFNPHGSAIAELQKLLNSVEDRLPRSGVGSEKTPITWRDVKQFKLFRADLADDKSAREQMEQWIKEQSGNGPWVPFQPAALNADGSVTIPETFRTGRSPGEIVALYAAPIDPRVRLMVDYDTMLLKAATHLENDMPKLVSLVRKEANDDGALSRDEVNQIRVLIDAIAAATESLEPMMAFRQKLAGSIIDVPGPIYILPPYPRDR